MAYALISTFSKTISSLTGEDTISIDNWTFKAFYQATPAILGVSTVLVCTRKATDGAHIPKFIIEYKIQKKIKLYRVQFN